MRNTMTAARLFREAYLDRTVNCMTPDYISMGMASSRVAWELATGLAFDNERVWGVTVVVIDYGGTARPAKVPISQLHHTRREADEYILSLDCLDPDNLEDWCGDD